MSARPTARVDLRAGVCSCGCEEATAARSRFRQGHDARAKSALLRAHREERSVEVTDAAGARSNVSALEAASTLSTDRHDWTAALQQAARPKPRSTKAKQDTKPTTEPAAKSATKPSAPRTRAPRRTTTTKQRRGAA